MPVRVGFHCSYNCAARSHGKSYNIDPKRTVGHKLILSLFTRLCLSRSSLLHSFILSCFSYDLGL